MTEQIDLMPDPVAPQPSPLRVWIVALLTPHWVTAAFTAMLALATLALVWISIKQHGDAVDAIEARTDWRQQRKTRRSVSPVPIENGRDTSQPRFDKITDDIRSHNGKFHLPKYPNTADADVEEGLPTFGRESLRC
jgi:hypothetical protein